jgi:hypothetical protein
MPVRGGSSRQAENPQPSQETVGAYVAEILSGTLLGDTVQLGLILNNLLQRVVG